MYFTIGVKIQKLSSPDFNECYNLGFFKLSFTTFKGYRKVADF
jgi:hypothetical protein